VSAIDYNTMTLDELRRYVLAHRNDSEAFYTYVDRSKVAGRMITIDPRDPHWEEKLDDRLKKIDDRPTI